MFGTSRNLPHQSGRIALRGALTISVIVSAVALAACGGHKDKATQVAAKVNKEEISVHQINFVLSQAQGIKPEQRDAASKVVLERLIDQELAYQKAQEQKLDRDPNVLQAIEAAKRQIVVQNYMAKVASAAKQPSDVEIKQYYDSKPALFSERRIFSIQELAAEVKPEQAAALKAKLAGAKNMQEIVATLQADGVHYNVNQAVRTAEQLPLSQLDTIHQMKDGQMSIEEIPTGLHVVILAASESKPVALAQAKPFIEQFLLNERRRQLIEGEGKSLRNSAKIEYVGNFAKNPGAPASGAEVAVPALPGAASQ